MTDAQDVSDCQRPLHYGICSGCWQLETSWAKHVENPMRLSGFGDTVVPAYVTSNAKRAVRLHTAFVGVIVICLCLAGACGAFCNLGLVAMGCRLLLFVLLALLMLTELIGCAYLAMLVLLGMRGT